MQLNATSHKYKLLTNAPFHNEKLLHSKHSRVGERVCEARCVVKHVKLQDCIRIPPSCAICLYIHALWRDFSTDIIYQN